MKPSRQFRPSLDHSESLEDRKLLSTLKPFYSQRLPIYQPLETQTLPTPTIPRFQLQSTRVYELLPPPGQTNPVSVSDYKVGGVTIVPFGYPYAAAHPGMTLVSLSSNPDGGGGPPSEVISVGTLGERQSFYQSSPSEMILTNPAMFRSGFVTVGVTPTTYDPATTITSSSPGELRVLNRVGQPVMIISDPNLISGPSAFAWLDRGNSASLFVANSINGTVSRFDFRIFQRGLGAIRLQRSTLIGAGFSTAGSATTNLQGPSGLSYDDKTDTLYVASTLDNAVYAIDRASRVRNVGTTGRLIFNNSAWLSNPAGVTLSPSRTLLVTGDLISGGTGMAEFDLRGQYIANVATGTAASGAGSITWNHSLYGFGPEVVTLNGNDKTIQFFPLNFN
ncbi:MAG: hypothetical protein RJA81_1902 [Planctomycetota bacterium]|jgi:hypothetical protein